MVENFFVGRTTGQDVYELIENTPLLAAGERALDVARWNYGVYG